MGTSIPNGKTTAFLVCTQVQEFFFKVVSSVFITPQVRSIHLSKLIKPDVQRNGPPRDYGNGFEMPDVLEIATAR
jgi:hypothetical protein